METLKTHEDLSGEGVRGCTVGEGIESNLGGGVLRLAKSRTVVRGLEDLAVEINGGLEPRRVIRTFPNARVRWQVEAAPLRQLLKLVLVHFPFSDRFACFYGPTRFLFRPGILNGGF